jgi:hypothetical protein
MGDAMAIKTNLEKLEEVQSAISAVMAGQSYSIAGRAVTHADLVALTKYEEILLERYAAESGTRYPAINIGTMRRAG